MISSLKIKNNKNKSYKEISLSDNSIKINGKNMIIKNMDPKKY